MLKSLKIENFRSFKSFELQKLGRINLLVGKNNSGKTSLLEAVYILHSNNPFDALTELLSERGEYQSENEDSDYRSDSELDIKNLFLAREMELGSEFSITATTSTSDEKISAKIGEYESNFDETTGLFDDQPGLFDDQSEVFDDSGNAIKELSLDLTVNKDGQTETLRQRLSENLGVVRPRFRRSRVRRSTPKTLSKGESNVRFLTSSSLSSRDMAELFEQHVLNPEELLLYDALKTIEPTVERIASLSSKKAFFVKLSGFDQRIPIGSLGDGVSRILALALSIMSAKDGILLIDEIDTGLHYSVMSKMWDFLWKTTRQFNIQVFATTHSSDCWQSLADIAGREDLNGDGIRIHRIEKGADKSVVFDERKIVVAANREIEVR
ncbi:MAG: AAA family ATPase [Cyanobacteria bacterium P01_G01_bin.38]